MVDRVVQAAALLPAAGAGDDELGNGRDVAQLDQVAGEEEVPVVLADLVLEESDPLPRPGEPPLAAHDPDVVPHETANLVPVLRHDDRLVAVDGVSGVPGAHVGRAPAIV